MGNLMGWGHGWMDVLFCLLSDISGSLGFGMGVLIFFVSSWLGSDPKFLVVLVVFSPVFFSGLTLMLMHYLPPQRVL